MKDATVSDSRKQQKTTSMRRSEANFLRFLRTSERPQNYTTLKIIGKGAFGEVKLVQRKHDGKIYALKSLVKAEMVRRNKVKQRIMTDTSTTVQEGPTCPRACRTRHSCKRRQSLARQAAYLVPRFDLPLHAHGILARW